MRTFADMNGSDIEKWIKQNSGADAATLLLRAGNDERRRRAAVQHICRRKTASKLPTLTAHVDFQFPTTLSAEQCTSEALASFHAGLIDTAETVADLTTGLGVDSFFIARRCRKLTSVELNPEVSEVFIHNIGVLGADNIEHICADSIGWLSSAGHFSTIFIDPYRRNDTGGRVFALSDCRPDVVGNIDLLLSHCSTLIIKASPMLDLERTIRELSGHVDRIIFVGTPRECKEMVIICADKPSQSPSVEAVTLFQSGKTMTFKATATTDAIPYAVPKPGNIVYEPYPAVMKTGAFDSFACQYGCSPLAHDSHLFVSEEEASSDVPANAFRIENVMPFDKRSCREISRNFTHLNVAVRNFTLKAPELEKRLGTKPGGTLKIYGTTLADGSRKLLLVSEITSQTYEP